jgi:glycosyltransferase involved in cell wall biosynthesis
MPKISINILTKNRAGLLASALSYLDVQKSLDDLPLTDFEIIVVNDGSTDETQNFLEDLKKRMPNLPLKIINHDVSLGITTSRQEALEKSLGSYIAVIDDDDNWSSIWNDNYKLAKQSDYLDKHPDYVLVGGAMKTIFDNTYEKTIKRPQSDFWIRRTMLFRNNFFTSTVMFRRQAAIDAGGFVKDADDLAEDYDLWLRIGKLGKMHNFRETFVNYRTPSYNKVKFRQFLKKQLRLVGEHSSDYPYAVFAAIILKLRIWFGI